MTIELAKLRDPFSPSDVQWRIGQAGENQRGIWAKVLAYIDNRAIMDRLDAIVSPENWWNEYLPGPGGGVICGITIDFGQRQVTKWDGAENSDIEAVKGGLSDSMKRAAVQWGVGRYLYDLGESWAVISDNGAHFANCKIKKDGAEKWINFKWDHPKLPAWAIPNGNGEPPAQTVAKIEQETGGKVHRASDETKLSPNQQRVQELINLITAAQDDDALTNIAQLTKADFDTKKITKSNFDYVLSAGRTKRESLKAVDKMNETFEEAMA